MKFIQLMDVYLILKATIMASKKVFRGKTIENLYEEIYNSQQANADEISLIINELRNLIQEETSAAILAPMIGSMLGNKIKNTQLLIDLTRLVQKSLEVDAEGAKIGIPEDELRELLNAAGLN